MKIDLEQIKTNDKFHWEKSGFVYSGFVKTCDELVKGHRCGSRPGKNAFLYGVRLHYTRGSLPISWKSCSRDNAVQVTECSNPQVLTCIRPGLGFYAVPFGHARKF